MGAQDSEQSHLHGEEAREPAQHVLRDVVLPVRVDAKSDVIIQDRLKVPGKPVQDACMGYRERQRSGAHIMTVRQW